MDNEGIVVTTTLQNRQSFHPHIVTTITGQPQHADCWLDVVYQLPASVFVDPNQLADLADLNHPWVFGETDLEVPLEHVKESRGSVVVVRHQAQQIVTIDLPIHLRYQRPSADSAYRQITIPPPTAGWTCSKPPYDISGATWGKVSLPPLELSLIPSQFLDTSLSFSRIGGEQPSLTLEVPVGKALDASKVEAGTFACIVICSVWILWATWKSVTKRRRLDAKGKRRKSE